MTAKQFVQEKIPKSFSEKQVSGRIKGMQTIYYLIRELKNTMYIAEGETESKAWTNAKNYIIEKEKNNSDNF